MCDLVDCSYQLLTAPAIPSTKCFCIKMNNIMIGITAIEPPAAIPVQSTVFSPLNAYKPTANVLEDGLFSVNTKGSIKHDKRTNDHLASILLSVIF